MHPILFQLRILPWYLLIWSFAGLALAWILVIIQAAPWSTALLFSLPSLLLYGFIAASAYYVCRALPLVERTVQRVFLMFGSASLVSALAWIFLCSLFNNLCLFMGGQGFGIIITERIFVILFVIAVLFYLASLLAHDVLIAIENLRDAELKWSAAQVLARDAQLQLLRSQINPHFLFNSLNSISALTAINAVAARKMVIELGNFFRKSLSVSNFTKIAFSEELALCEHYLAVEKIRFEDRLQTNITIEPEVLSAQVPPMFLQPLIENAIKHGICNLKDGGTVTVLATMHDAWLYISVSNPIDMYISTAGGTALGLKNLKARFENIYSDSARVTWNNEQHIFRVEIIIPFEA